MGVMKGKMARLKVNPFMAKWIEASLRGSTPRFENERDLSIRRVVHAAYADQNTIGWDNLSKGRVASSMIRLQDWWKKNQAGTGTETRMGSEVVVQKALGLALMTRHELWKGRSRQVVNF